MSQPDPTPPPKTKSPRWMRVLLGISLALNLVIVGAVAGTAYRVKDRWAGKTPPPPSLSVTLYRALDPDTRHKLRRQAVGGHETLRAQREADRQALFAALQAEPFEVSAVARILDGQAAQQQAFRAQLRQSWLGQLDSMSAQERAALVERIKHRRFKGHRDPHRPD